MATVEKEMGLLEVERSAPPVLVERQLQRLHRQGGGLEQAQDGVKGRDSVEMAAAEEEAGLGHEDGELDQDHQG